MRIKYFLNIILISFLSLTFANCESSEPSIKETNKGSIFGVVTDFATGEPVANANVQLRPGGETTLTGFDGTYEFLDIEDGNYSITISKAEYSELIDDYIIQIRNGKRIRRDVQIEKLPTTLRITDMNGQDITELDFGDNLSTTSKSFNIFNNGTVSIKCKIVYTCNWISSVSKTPDIISPGQTVPVTVQINRSLLPIGQNITNIAISTNNGSAEIVIKATGTKGNPPAVQIQPINRNHLTATSVICEGTIIDKNGGEIRDCGFYYSTSPNPDEKDMTIQFGPGQTNFSSTIINLKPKTKYYIKAYAISNLGIGYSPEIVFETLLGLPICGETTFTEIAGSIAWVKSTIKAADGYKVLEGGFCWSTNPQPSINDNIRSTIYPEGELKMFIAPLQFNTTYWVRSYAKSEIGISYGPVKQFKTNISD